jgi:hypothetical protein
VPSSTQVGGLLPLPGPEVHTHVVLLEGPVVSVLVICEQGVVALLGFLQTGSWVGSHVTVPPPDLKHWVPSGHAALQLAASADVGPNANNDIEVSNSNDGTRNIGLSVIGGEAGVVSHPKIPCWRITSLDWEEVGLDQREISR